MTLPEITELFSTDDKCREVLERLRWPNGPECPRCKTLPVVRLSTNVKLLWCPDCEYQFSVTAGTIFNDSHLPLSKWFIATLLLVEARKGFSANQMKRTLGVSYKTAWYLCHRIRAAMKEYDQSMLAGTVEMDESYVGGRKRGSCIRGHGAEKEVVIGLRQRNGDLRFLHAKDARSATLAQYIRDNVSKDVDVMVTDEWSAYPDALRRSGKIEKRRTIRHKGHVYVDGDIHVDTVESAFILLKRGVIGTGHRISAKHLAAYLDEMTFRFNRRKSPAIFLDTLRHMVNAPVLTFEKLTA
jgi:transposase-like protein